MRGKPRYPVLPALSLRITPAGAGKTQARHIIASINWDHPRGCGENIQQECSTCGQIGSPPRMRGKQSADPEPENENGITPADAGKTVPSSTRFAYATDHPRGCGENFEQVIDVKQVAGSPPRMRGKQTETGGYIFKIGITPADAGKTGSPRGHRPQNGDHPRGCGENRCMFSKYACNIGSPPRMRGKRRVYPVC